MNFFKPEYVLSFLVGGAIMSIELMSAKMLEPHFGNSMLLWSSILGFTMFGLALGYLVGGKVSINKNASSILILILIISSILIFFTPNFNFFLINVTESLDLKSSIFLVSLFIVFPHFLLLGTCSPLIIRITTTSIEQIGNVSGVVFSLSTLGGVIFTPLMGLYVLPYYGLKLSNNIWAFILFFCFVYYLTIFLMRKINLKTKKLYNNY